MIVVVDASVLVDALGAGRDAEALAGRISHHELHAPALIDYEVVAAVRRLALAGRLDAARAGDLLADFEQLPLRRWTAADAYDAAYLALAEALDRPLLTRDGRLARTVGHAAVVELV
jgi:predicted nucleic acid-binding protein